MLALLGFAYPRRAMVRPLRTFAYRLAYLDLEKLAAMLSRQTLYASLILLLALCTASGQDTTRGKTLFQPCTACHGLAGEGNRELHAPRIAGLPEWYLVQQLENFRTRRRGTHEADLYGGQMARMAEQLWDGGEVAAVAHYVASLPAIAPTRTVRGGKASRGKTLFATCAACHGEGAEGNAELKAPPLHGLDDWYVSEQLEAFRQGWRGTHNEDLPGQQMRAALATLSDHETHSDIVAHLATLAAPPRDRAR